VNNFAEIKPLFKYRRVAYYSVTINGSQNTLYEDFVSYHEVSNKNKLYHILKWIQVIGKRYGAQSRFFRNEAFISDTSALPPIGKDREPSYVEDFENKANNLRLYCLRANEHVVFLFNGDIKTAGKAQDCPNVRKHFLLANKLSKAINDAFINKDIIWIESGTLIDVEPDFKLYY